RFSHYLSEKLTTAIPGRYIGLQKRMGGPRIGIILSLSASRSRGTRQRKVGPVRKAKVGILVCRLVLSRVIRGSSFQAIPTTLRLSSRSMGAENEGVSYGQLWVSLGN